MRTSSNKLRYVLAALLVAVLSLTGLDTAWAAEGGTGVYLLGYRVLLPGIMPKPGLYLRNDCYWYSADAGKVVIVDDVNLDAKITAFADLITVTYVPDFKILGAQYGIGVLQPIGYAHVKSQIEIMGEPLAESTARAFGGGDTILFPAMLGWQYGDFHFVGAVFVFFPTGQYKKDAGINIGKNRFAVDPNIAVTWLHAEGGHEISAAVGYTMNRENKSTHYKTGDELHIDFTLAQHFASGLAVGLGGYFYKQVTSDSGDGAVLGGMRGRILGLGPLVSYSTKINGHDIMLSLKYFGEVWVKDRWQGDAIYFTTIIKL